MLESIDHARQSMNRRYDNLFNFYFQKHINDLCFSRPHSPHVILFEDYDRFDCEDEMLKRLYSLKEVSRINLLAQYYQKNRVLPNEAPSLFLTTGRKPLIKRIKRRIKAQVKASELDDAQQFQGEGSFLQSVGDSGIPEEESDLLGNISVETQTYNIYQIQGAVLGRHNLDVRLMPLYEDNQQQVGEVPSHLVIDFKDLQTERILEEYSMLAKLNRQGISKAKKQGNPSRHRNSSSAQNQDVTVLRKSQPKRQREQGKTYIVKGLRNPQRPIRIDQTRLQQIGTQKQRRFIKGFQAQMLRSPPQTSATPRLRVYTIQDDDRLSSQTGRLASQWSPASGKYYKAGQMRGSGIAEPKSDFQQRLELIKNTSNESRQKTLGYQTLKHKAKQIQQQALRTVYRLAAKNVRSTEYIPLSSQRS